MTEKQKIHLAVFASGNGSNAQNIAEYFRDREDVAVVRIYSNKEDAYVLQRAARLNIPVTVFSGKEMRETDKVLKRLKEDQTDFIILAGFMLKIPPYLVEAYRDKILNMHPALLPKYGGKGMYGHHVHEAVKAAGEKETGITIHRVNEHYDRGAIIFQKPVALSDGDTPEEIAQKVHQLEYEYFPKVIDDYIHQK